MKGVGKHARCQGKINDLTGLKREAHLHISWRYDVKAALVSCPSAGLHRTHIALSRPVLYQEYTPADMPSWGIRSDEGLTGSLPSLAHAPC